jgi:hypothetical protein
VRPKKEDYILIKPGVFASVLREIIISEVRLKIR